MSSKIGDEESNLERAPNVILNEGEIALVKKASRAFAVGYVNQLYRTIKVMDPSLVKKLAITKQYPYDLSLFIHQSTPGRIDQLDIYSHRKHDREGGCQVKEIYHSAECEPVILEEKRNELSQNCMNWRWNSLEIPKMYVMAISEGRRVGRSICSHSVFSSAVVPKTFLKQNYSLHFPTHGQLNLSIHKI